MKRYVCCAVAGLLLALASAGPAAADGLPGPGQFNTGQSATQVSSFGDQSTGEQSNTADITQAQGNGNVNVSPAVSVFGDAETENEQGNENTAIAKVGQENEVEQSQSSEQDQSLEQSGDSKGCCAGQSQTGEQKTYGGDQSSGNQSNDATVDQWQGNGNVNVSPAVSVFGDAETKNEQGNGNVAYADVEQENEVEQEQTSTQDQSLTQSGGSGSWKSCCNGQSQTGEQKTSFGDQSTGEQSNTADVTQKQGNGNVNVSPAVAPFGKKHDSKHDSCDSKCGEQSHSSHKGGDAETENEQGNENTAIAKVGQENEVEQSQSSEQDQSLEQSGDSKGCCAGQSQTGEQKTYGGDQSSGNQSNDATVDQWQGNGNVNVSPAVSVFGDAETKNEQGNGNVAYADVEQENEVEQEQTSTQDQSLTQSGGGGSCCKPRYDDRHDCKWEQGDDCKSPGKGYCEKPSYDHSRPCKDECGKGYDRERLGKGQYGTRPSHGSHGCSRECEPHKGGGYCKPGQEQTGEQKTYFGDQSTGEQSNTADVTQKQGNWNANESPAFSVFHDAETTNEQGNDSTAIAKVGQENEVEQSQVASQVQTLSQGVTG